MYYRNLKSLQHFEDSENIYTRYAYATPIIFKKEKDFDDTQINLLIDT
jgi:hypothetical protein